MSRRLMTALCLATFAAPASAEDETPKPRPAPEAPKTAVPLNPAGTALLDAKTKTLYVRGVVALREGALEMLLCKKNTKEHESIVAYDGKAYLLHGALVATGLETGRPVSFTPQFRPPTGRKLKIDIVWIDDDGKTRRTPAHEWVRHAIHRYFAEPLAALPAGLTLPTDTDLRYDAANAELSWYGPMTDAVRDRLLGLSRDAAYRKAVKSFYDKSQSRAMAADWVFVGSGFLVDEAEGHKAYLAESGDVICVANFPSAMIDVAEQSGAEGADTLTYEAWTERIPPQGTPVLLEISPVAEKPAGESPQAAEQEAFGPSADLKSR